MRIGMSYEQLDEAMKTVTSVVSDRLLQDDLKNVIVWYKDGVMRLCAYSMNIVSSVKVEATVLGEEETDNQPELFAQLRAKEVNDIIATLKGLKRTYVSSVELDIRENEAFMVVKEEPIDEEMVNAAEYRQSSRFRVTKPPTRELVKTEVQTSVIEKEGVEFVTEDVQKYITALYPTVQKEVREATSNVMFADEYIYTVLATYVAVMENKLGETFSGFRLPNSVVNFVRSFIGGSEVFHLHKEARGNGMVVLTLSVGDSISVIKCGDMSRAYDMTEFVHVPGNGIVVDRAYLVDVLKRLNLTSEPIGVKVEIKGENESTLRVESSTMAQDIPLVTAKGSGAFAFVVRPDLLSDLVFSHYTNGEGEYIMLYFEEGVRGRTVMAVKDNTNEWQTKITGLTEYRGSTVW